MTVPGEAALRLLWGLVLGAVMGLCYDFLRPLRRKRNTPADLVFLVAALYLWVYYSFKICRGDIRLGGTASLGIGCLLWLSTASKVLRRVFYLFWLVIFHIFSLFYRPFIKIFQKICQLSKKVFAYGKKRSTIRRVSVTLSTEDPEEPKMSKHPNSQPKERSPLFWVKLAVLLVIVFSTVALLTTHLVIEKLKQTNANLQSQALELEDENKDLQEQINLKDTDEGVKDVAKDELDMVDPDTVIYDFD